MFHVEHLKEKRQKSAEDLQLIESLPLKVKERLEIYHNLLKKWQKAINLVSRGTLDDFYSRHIIDSMQLMPFIRGRTLDIGSGGGFPGMALAIIGAGEITCLDSDRRKILFLSEVARETGVSVNLINDRAENISEHFDTVTARGFAELKKLLELTSKISDCGVFLKGKDIPKEIEQAQRLFEFKYELHDSKTGSGKVVIVHDIQRKDI